MKPFQIVECEQGTPEWFAARLGKFTGSNASDLIYEPGIYKSGKKKGQEKPIPKTFMNLVNEKRNEAKHGISQHEIDIKVGRCVRANYNPSIGINGEYGKMMESDALEYYSKKYNEQVYQIGLALSNTYPEHVGTSPDALHVLKNSGVEVKCPVTLSVHDSHFDLKTPQDLKELNESYYWQVLHNIYVCEAENWDFVSYFPWVKPEFVMSCLVINRADVLPDLELLDTCIKKAIELKTK